MSFITSISAHGPYTNNVLCEDAKISDQSECYRYVCNKTDNMLSNMLKRLKSLICASILPPLYVNI